MLFAVVLLFFLVIGGVSASDVMECSDNPSNDDSVIDSASQFSQESVANYNDQNSNESISNSNSLTTDNISNLEIDDDTELDKTKTSNAVSASSSKKTSKSKTASSLIVSSYSVYYGNQLIITLKDKNSKVLSGKKVSFYFPKIKNTYTKTTDSKGQAKITLKTLGDLNVIVSFAGDSSYKASKRNITVKVSKYNTNLKISKTTVAISTPVTFTLTEKSTGAALKGKKIVITAKSGKYTKTTDSKGQVNLTINIRQNFSITAKFASELKYNGSSYNGTIKPVQCGVKFASNLKTVAYGHSLAISLKNKVNSNPVANRSVVLSISNKGKTYNKTTNSKGVVYLPIKYIGSLKIKASFAGDAVYKKASLSTTVKGVKDSTAIKSSTTQVGKGGKYIVTLKDSAGKALSNKTVKFTIKNKTYTKTTNSKGQASLTIKLADGTYSIKTSYGGNSHYKSSKLTKKFKVNSTLVQMSDIIKAATTLRAYVDYTNRLNKSYVASVGGVKYSLDEFSYLMAEALVNIKKGSSADVAFKNLSGNYASKGNTINGNLYKANYIALANNLIKYVNSNNKIPTNMSTGLGKVEANLYIWGLTKALQYYGEKKVLPNYVILKTSYIKGSSSSTIIQNAHILNYKETFNATEFAKYLKTGGKSALNSAIIAKAKALTKGLTSSKAKANAIFKFVRDQISYSYYSDSKKGAAKTLSTKSANCCDKANLIVAMCRSVGVYARYSHAQGCTFSSGLVTGHVWAQVYDKASQTWLTADATSYRNQLGVINNWNTKSYSNAKNYVLIPF